MIFYGWGKKSKEWDIGNGQHAVLVWNYFHIFWCPVAWGGKWYIVGDKRSEDREISQDEIRQYFPHGAPKPNVWQRFGLLIVASLLIFYGVVAG